MSTTEYQSIEAAVEAGEPFELLQLQDSVKSVVAHLKEAYSEAQATFDAVPTPPAPSINGYQLGEDIVTYHRGWLTNCLEGTLSSLVEDLKFGPRDEYGKTLFEIVEGSEGSPAYELLGVPRKDESLDEPLDVTGVDPNVLLRCLLGFLGDVKKELEETAEIQHKAWEETFGAACTVQDWLETFKLPEPADSE